MRTLNSVFVKQPLSLVCDMARLTFQSLMIFFFQDREGINKNTQCIVDASFNGACYKYIHCFPVKTIL